MYNGCKLFRYASESIRLACDYAYKDVEQDSTLGGKPTGHYCKQGIGIETKQIF